MPRAAIEAAGSIGLEGMRCAGKAAGPVTVNLLSRCTDAAGCTQLEGHGQLADVSRAKYRTN